MTPLLATTAPSPLWYLTRGTGLVALVLLTATVVLGVVNTSRWATPGWPRFATAGLHRNLSLLVVTLLAVHILTAELDTFAPVGWLAVVVPFTSTYRPIWLGLGTLAFDLLLALIATSLVRLRLGYRAWRAVHWAGYLSWPVALAHGLGTGTDPRLGWVQLLAGACAAVVAAAVAWRLVHDFGRRPGVHLAAAGAGVATVVALTVWTVTGPLRPGWARRAGTPPRLLATTRPTTPHATTAPGGGGATTAPGGGGGTVPPSGASGAATPPAGAGPTGTPGGGGSSPGLPAPPFSAGVTGTLTQTPTDAGEVTITIRAAVSGGATGRLEVVMRGASAGGGVSLQASEVTFGPPSDPGRYRGYVAALNGEQLVAAVQDRAGQALDLGLDLHIDPTSGSVRGTLDARVATGAGTSGAGTSGAGTGGSPAEHERDGDR